ncbi:MAG: ribonuclease J [bacterium]|nr:ribonuclease J [bacterium]
MSELKIIPLGGMGTVTQNMFVYQYDDEMLIVDCGIGFPDNMMPGVDVLIPDVSYILQQLEQGKKIVGMILTHGHDDHIAATPYILPELPEFPIYASPLTVGFAENRMRDGGIDRTIQVVEGNKVVKISEHFSAQAIEMTHSVPDTRHYAIHTPEGIIYHGSDFKLDKNPVDGVLPNYGVIDDVSKQGVLCMLIDCLRVERGEWTKSESMCGPVIEKEMASTEGMFILTLMSSHIHRIQQAVDAAVKLGRRVAFIGRSVEQNVDIALTLRKLDIPKENLIDKRDIQDFAPEKVCAIIAGSQGQEGSSLMRAIYGDHPVLRILPKDKVVFSADVIPGNEINFYGAIDELSRNGITIVYPDLSPDIHQSGHASRVEQQDLLNRVKPQYVLPVGGADRHRFAFTELVAEPVGVSRNQVLLPAHGEILSFSQGKPRVADTISLKPRLVDGLGIGDVGPIVLSDRRALGQAGIIVLVIPRVKGQLDIKNINVVSRGFVFMKEADEVIGFIKRSTGEIINDLGKKAKDEDIKRAIERKLARKLYKVIKREPMIVPVMVDA